MKKKELTPTTTYLHHRYGFARGRAPWKGPSNGSAIRIISSLLQTDRNKCDPGVGIVTSLNDLT